LEFLEDLGKGNGGIVKKARHKPTNRLVAVKVLFKKLSITFLSFINSTKLWRSLI